MNNIVMKKATKEYFNTQGKSVSADFNEQANKVLLNMYDRAAERAEENNRKTVMAKDL